MSDKKTRKNFDENEACRLYEQERLIVWTAEAIADAMKEAGLAKAELAEKLGKTRAYITQLLGGSRNMTLRTLADLAYACGKRAEVEFAPLEATDFQKLFVSSVNRPRHRVVRIESPMLNLHQTVLRIDDKGNRLAA